ncbi:hypothetical protein ABPG74_010149 [Tetrahymena malaccensis]
MRQIVNIFVISFLLSTYQVLAQLATCYQQISSQFQCGATDSQCQQQFTLLQNCAQNCVSQTSNSSTQVQSQCFLQCQSGITFTNVLDVFHKIQTCVIPNQSSSSDSTTSVPAQSTNSTDTSNTQFITQVSSCAGKVQNPCQASDSSCLSLQLSTYNCFASCLTATNSQTTFTNCINSQCSSQMQQYQSNTQVQSYANQLISCVQSYKPPSTFSSLLSFFSVLFSFFILTIAYL